MLLREKGGIDGKPFSDLEVHQFLLYYELVLKWNSRLHLTTITEPRQFFQRHIWEACFAESLLLPQIARVWDLGSGLGVPGIPVAILRPGISVNLVEAKLNKAMFLEEVANALSFPNLRVSQVRIESLKEALTFDCLMARAVENMEKMIPIMIRIGQSCSQLLLLGSDSIGEAIKSHLPPNASLEIHHLPATSNQYIFNIRCST